MKNKKILIPGFQFAGIHAGIKDNPRKKDLSFIYSEEPQTLIDGVFTKNKVCAAPVEVCKKNIKLGLGQLVVVNSGVANACTGKKGLNDALNIQKQAASLLNLSPSKVFVSSTGKIGDTLPMKNILKGLDKAKEHLRPNGFMDAARGIMTTDQWPKVASVTGLIGEQKYTIAVMAKGAGMIRPDMATMLCYIMTDLKFEKKVLSQIFRNAVNVTLNRMTVDGDMSTNDTVLIMANGRCGNETFDAHSELGKKIEKELTFLLEIMARSIVLDGEGATKCCYLKVSGAANEKDAQKIAYAIGQSPLVKTAFFGNDPNWGRIMAAVGYSGAKIHPDKISIQIGPYKLVRNGRGTKLNPPSVISSYMKRREQLEILVECGKGKGEFHLYFSDLTYDYIHLNAEYRT